jgi:hypothetical protein
MKNIIEMNKQNNNGIFSSHNGPQPIDNEYIGEYEEEEEEKMDQDRNLAN